MKLTQFEIIEWLDHSTYAESKWRSKEELEKLEPIKVLTMGFLVKEDKTSVTVASTYSNEGHLAGEFNLIKKAIIRRKSIKNPWKGWS